MSDPEIKMNIPGCAEMGEMFSPMLDGELADADRARLEQHLLICESCRRELGLWKRIAATLRGDVATEEPPADFCANVMSRLSREVRPRRRLAVAWRTPAAAAAAAIMLFAGTWGTSVALKDNKPGTVVVMGQNDPVDIVGGIEQGSVQGPGQPTQQQEAVKPGNQQAAGGEPESRPGDRPNASPTPPSQVAGAGVRVSDAVLLNSRKEIQSTLLKLSVPNTMDAQHTALALAANYSGSGQVLATQKKGLGELVILRLTVPLSAGKSLVNQLAGLGGIIDRTDERKDITESYNQSVNRLSEITARLESDMTPAEMGQLEAEASGIRRQLESWNTESESNMVILWLEH